MFEKLFANGAIINEKAIVGLLILLLVGGGLWRSGHLNSGSRELTLIPHSEETQQAWDAGESEKVELITVHLTGAANNPGIYHLPAGARVYELLNLAGGLSIEADPESLNQARPLMDGEQIHIARQGEQPVPAAMNSQSGVRQVNINTAGQAELSTLPGIGEVRAGQIIAHREKYGFFKDPRELMDVSGIGEKTYENLADMITIY